MHSKTDRIAAVTDRPAAKVSLVEAACSRFESQQAAAAVAAPQTVAGAPDNPFKRRAHERLRLLQNAGVADAGNGTQILAPVIGAMANNAPPSGHALNAGPRWSTHGAWHVVLGAACVALATALVMQLSKSAVSTSVTAAAIPAVGNRATGTVSTHAVEPLQLQLDHTFATPPVRRP